MCVLGSVYGWEQQAIATQLLDLVSALPLVVIDQPAVDQALRWYREGSRITLTMLVPVAVNQLDRGIGAQAKAVD